jgi:hypothetical protein
MSVEPEPRERVEHQLAGAAERLDERQQRLNRLLGRMQSVAGVLPVEHIRDRREWGRGLPLGQQVGGHNKSSSQVSGISEQRVNADSVTLPSSSLSRIDRLRTDPSALSEN